MKKPLTIAAVLLALAGHAQLIQSDVYRWENLPVEKKEKTETRRFINGSGVVLKKMEVTAVMIDPGATSTPSANQNEEIMIAVKEGNLKVTIGNKSQTMGPGSIGFAIPGEPVSVENPGNGKGSYHVFRFTSKNNPDVQRARDAGGSFFLDWNDIKFSPHDRGGVRQYFTRPTATLNRLDIHVTTLNAGIKSHEPHTHKVEEIVLMIEGNGEMEIANAVKKAATGDLIYLESKIPHAIKNVDTKPIMYYAIQWE
jgi:(S)-ureidoglycine aminohydrolase